MAKRTAAGASSALVAQTAREALGRGNAVDAVAAGVLAAVAESPAVLLGPIQVLIGGAGAGLLAVDGRVRQPGLSAPRPRGVLPGQPVPAEARVGVPALPMALAAALASAGRSTLARAAGWALECARSLSAERAAVIEALTRFGAAALSQDAFVTELLAVVGRASGGALTREDLAAVRPTIVSCDEGSFSNGIMRTPWKSDSHLDAAATHLVAAIDSHGLAAIACYEASLDGLAIPALGLVAPLVAAPVLRGEVRVPPGEPRPAAAPIALRTRRGIVELAIGIGLSPGAGRSLEALLPLLAEEGAVLGPILASADGRPAAVLRTGDTVFVLASS